MSNRRSNPLMQREDSVKSYQSSVYQKHLSESSCWFQLAHVKCLGYDHLIHSSQLTTPMLPESVHYYLTELMRLVCNNNSRYLYLDIDSITRAELSDQQECNCVFLWAAYFGRVHLMQRLYEELGADLLFAHPQVNFNALHLLALYGSLDGVQWLLNEECPIVNTSTGLSPLHFAAYGKNINLCKYLIEEGCQVDRTVLHAAVYAGTLDCVAFILSLSSLPNEFDEDGLTALHIAVDLGNYPMVKLLLADPRINVNLETKELHYTALHLAAENGYADSMKELLNKGAHVNVRSVHGQTPLHLCCKHACVDCVQLLLEQHIDVNIQDNEERSALHAAISQSPWSLHIVRLLVEHKANIHLADTFGYTCLHMAALNELDDCVEYLIMEGANVAARTNGNISALNIINRKTPASIKIIPKRLDLALSYKEQNLKLNFRDILRSSYVGEIGLLRTLQNEGQYQVLEHPLCQAFLHLKWQRVKWYIIYRVILSIITALCLSYYVLICIRNKCCPGTDHANHKNISLSKNPNCGNCSDSLVKSTFNGTDPSSWQCTDFAEDCNNIPCHYHKVAPNCSNYIFGSMVVEHPEIISYVRFFFVMVLILNCVRAFFCFAGYRNKTKYFSNYVNLVELFGSFSYIMVFIDIKPDHESSPWVLPLGTLAVLICWIYLTIIIGHLPDFGSYIVMFNKVLREFLKMFIVFFCLLVGFMFTLCLLDSSHFISPAVGFTRVLAMMTGELNLKDLIIKEVDHNWIWPSMLFVLTLFIILVTVVLMNLLIGIAVNDVEGLRKKANLSKLILQTKLIYFVELCCFRGFFPKWIMELLRKFVYIWPNSYTVVLSVRPLSPHEKRIPKDIMDAAVDIAVRRTQARYNKNVKALTVEKRLATFGAQLNVLAEILTTINKNVKKLSSDNDKNRDAYTVPLSGENEDSN